MATKGSQSKPQLKFLCNVQLTITTPTSRA